MQDKEKTKINSSERRVAVRINCASPLSFKVCKDETIDKIMQGYTQNISNDGLRCMITDKVPIGSILWLKLDRDALTLCEELERNAIILQHGVLGKVVWIEKAGETNFEVGLQFLTREEKI